jgi:hypothetical protein
LARSSWSRSEAVRILEIRTEIREELVEPGFNGEFVVEPV